MADAVPGRRDELLRGRLLASNALWQLLSQVIPLAVGLLTIPVLLKGMGVERFGLLTLAWVFVGYFSFFDAGLSRALTHLASKTLQQVGAQTEIGFLAWTATAMMMVVAVIGGIVIAAGAHWLVIAYLKMPDQLVPEAIAAFYWIAATIPIVVLTAALRGLLQAKQQFFVLSAISVCSGVFSFLAPVAILPFSTNLAHIVAALAFAKVVVLVAHVVACRRAYPHVFLRVTIASRWIRPLLSFGAWVMAGNLLAPLTLYLDRLLMGGMVTVAAVAYYATPYEVITKIFFISGAVGAVVFPALSAALEHDRARAELIYRRAFKYVLFLMFPACLAVILFARDLLTLWLDADFAGHSYRVAQILAVGVLALGLAHTPWALLQSANRPDLATKLNLLELAPYLLLLWWLTGQYGIDGTALAWTIRAVIDGSALMWLSLRVIPLELGVRRKWLPFAALGIASLGLAFFSFTLGEKILLFLVVVATQAVFMWRLLAEQERQYFFRLGGSVFISRR
jgi:O-antigen/teichoic acid export membrane protein